MSCEGCEDAHDSSAVFPYRWKNATVLLVGCRAHVGEIMKALNDAPALADRPDVPAPVAEVERLRVAASRALALYESGDADGTGGAGEILRAALGETPGGK